MDKISAPEMAMAIRELKDNMPALMESLKIKAKAQKVYYDELIKSGFTDEQALHLCAKASV